MAQLDWVANLRAGRALSANRGYTVTVRHLTCNRLEPVRVDPHIPSLESVGLVLLVVLSCFPVKADVLSVEGTVDSLSHDARGRDEPCKIVFGHEQRTLEVTAQLAPGGQHRVANLANFGWGYVLSTTGPCSFVVYNHANFGAPSVDLGTNLTGAIRPGIHGVISRALGGNGTWRARSVEIARPAAAAVVEGCQIDLGDNGRTMTYITSAAQVPLMGVVRRTLGRNCRFTILAESQFGGRYKYAFPGIENSDSRGFVPGYPTRSLKIDSWRQDVCPRRASIPNSQGNYQGRCLPVSKMPEPQGVDSDHDGVDDNVEEWLRETFAPELVFDSGQAPQFGAKNGRPENAKFAYQVFALDPHWDQLELAGALLWTEDRGWGDAANPLFRDSDRHVGDVSSLTMRFARAAVGTAYYVPTAVELWNHARWEDGRSWRAQWPNRKGPAAGNRGFDYNGTHARVYLSAHKHHPYNDTGWDHQDSAYSWSGIGEDVNGKGMVTLPSPAVNVGNRNYRLVSSMRGVSAEFADYDFWTSSEVFCGGQRPGSSRECTRTVLSEKVLTQGRCGAPAWCP